MDQNKIDTINDVEIYDTYKDLHLSEKGIKSPDGLKAHVGAKKDRWLGNNNYNPRKWVKRKRFAIPLDFDFFKHPIYPYRLLKDLIVRLVLNSS